MKTHSLILMAVATLALLPIAHAEPAPSGQSPPGFRIHVADRPCDVVAPALDNVHLLMHRLAPAPDAVFDAPAAKPVVLPGVTLEYTLAPRQSMPRTVRYPLII